MSTQDIGLNNSASNLNYQTESRAVEHLSTRSDAITYQPVQLSDLPDVHQLEADGFAADEAASMTTIQYVLTSICISFRHDDDRDELPD
jgi:hypothetical protein